MERRKALALASTATLLVGSTIVSVASVSGASFLGFGAGSAHTAAAPDGSGSAPGVVRKTRNIYDRYVLDVGGPTAAASAGSARSASVVAAAPPNFAVGEAPGPSTPDGSTPTTGPAANHHPAAKSPGASNPQSPSPTPTTAPDEATPVTVPPTTAPPTTIPTTTTTWPRGVPRDWPKDKPIPPMPPNCRQPQLEDNGVWNCDH